MWAPVGDAPVTLVGGVDCSLIPICSRRAARPLSVPLKGSGGSAASSVAETCTCRGSRGVDDREAEKPKNGELGSLVLGDGGGGTGWNWQWWDPGLPAINSGPADRSPQPARQAA